MKNEREIFPGLLIGGQPAAEDIEDLRERGIASLVNLRTDDEEGVLAEEASLAHAAGLEYTHLPVSPETLDDAAVARFTAAVDSEGRMPVAVHCQGGGRAGLMVLLHQAVKQGWSVQRALEEGERLGIAPPPDGRYRPFFEAYLRRHSAGERQGKDAET